MGLSHTKAGGTNPENMNLLISEPTRRPGWYPTSIAASSSHLYGGICDTPDVLRKSPQIVT